jgi:hypothetical protein
VGMDLDQDARRLLDRAHVLGHPSDLDLLIFFARHPRSLLASEQLAAFLGYGVREIAASLDLLLRAALLTRTPHRLHGARLYVFSADDANREWLSPLLKLTSTREGRLALIWELRRRASQAAGASRVTAAAQTSTALDSSSSEKPQ